jgi:hypothetical protein
MPVAQPPTGDDAVDPLVGRAGSVLLYDDLSCEAEGHYCEQSLTVGPADDRAELLVRFHDDEPRIGLDEGHNDRQPAKRGLVAVGDGMEARTIASEETDFDEPIVMSAVLDPTNLRAIGTAISRFCDVWADDGYHVTVCFDSLTDVLAVVEPAIAFQFFHALVGRLDAVGATAHFHVDPRAHDEHLLRTFEEIMGEVFVEFEADEEALEVLQNSNRASDREIAARFGDEESLQTDGGRAIDAPDGPSEASDADIAAAIGES